MKGSFIEKHFSAESESEETNGERDSDDISDKQNSRKMYQIEVPPKIKCDLRITFKPRYVGLHHEVLEISFLSNNSIFDKQVSFLPKMNKEIHKIKHKEFLPFLF